MVRLFLISYGHWVFVGLLGFCALVAFVGPLSIRRLWPRRRVRAPTRLGELEDGARVTIVGQLEALDGDAEVAAVGVEAGLFRRVVHPCFSEATRLAVRTDEGVIGLDGPVAIQRGAVEGTWLVMPPELPEAAEARAERWGYPWRGTTVRILRPGDRVALTGIARSAPAPAGYRRPGERWLLTPTTSPDETEADVIVARFLGRPRIVGTPMEVRLGCAGLAAVFVLACVHVLGFVCQPESRYWAPKNDPSMVELVALVSPAHRGDTLQHLEWRNQKVAEKHGDVDALERLIRISQALPCTDADAHWLIRHGQLGPAEETATRCRDPFDLDDLSHAYLERGLAEDASRVAALHPSWSDSYVAHLVAGNAERLRSSVEHVETVDGGPTVGETYVACLRAALTGRNAQLEERWRQSRYPACALLLADRLRGEAALDVLADCPSCWARPELQGVTLLLAVREHDCAHSPEQVCFSLADRLDRWARAAPVGPFSLEDEVRTAIAAIDSPPPAAQRIHATLRDRHALRHDPHAYLHLRVVYDLGLFGCRGTNLDEADVPGRLVRAQQFHPAFVGLSPSEHPGWASLTYAASALAGLEFAGCVEPTETAFRVARMITTALEDPDLGLAYFLYPGDAGWVFWSQEPVHHDTRGTGRA